MKTLIIPDIHGRSTWKLWVNTEEFDRVVFLGDYFDSFHFTTEEQINNFLDIVEYKKTSGKEVIMLIGNHDHHYIVGNTGTSGFQQVGSFQICPVIDSNKEHLQMAYMFDNFLCTHAGVSEIFMDNCFGKYGWKIDTIAEDLNDLFKYKPMAFLFDGWDSSGDNIQQTPIWIRPNSLMKSSMNIKKQGIVQIVGHTQQRQIDKGKATGGRYYFVDTMETSGEFLLIEDNKVRIKK